MINHPTTAVLRIFLRSLPVADAGFLLHLLECPRCSRRAWKELSPRPMRRRPGEPRAPRLPVPETPGAKPVAAAEVCQKLAQERREERRFDESLALWERAAALYGRAAMPWQQAMALGELASLNLELRQEEDAILALEQILSLGATVPDPGLAAGLSDGSLPGLASRLAALKDPLEGRRLLAQLRERLGRRRAVRQRLDLLRAEGLAAAFLRQEHQAEKLLREAWTGSLRAGLPGPAVLVLADLGALFLRQGRGSALAGLAAEARRSLRNRDLPKPAQAALERLLTVFESGEATLDLLAGIALELAQSLTRLSLASLQSGPGSPVLP